MSDIQTLPRSFDTWLTTEPDDDGTIDFMPQLVCIFPDAAANDAECMPFEDWRELWGDDGELADGPESADIWP